jgi:spore coat protein CotH
MRRLLAINVVATAALLAVLNVHPPTLRAAPQDTPIVADQFFDDSVVRDIHLTAAASDWATLKRTFQENTYYPCTFSWNGITIANSTMRSRGSGTRNPQKPGLRVDFNRYNASQRFAGLKYFVLDNMWTDVAMIKERVTMLLFGRLGLPVPRETHVRLFVNDEYVGLYVAVEALDDVFIDRWRGASNGYLYEYNWLSDYRFQYLGTQLADYEMFEPKTRTKDPSSVLWGPIERMIWTMNETPDAIFEREISAYLDLTAFTRQIALDNFVAESDGMLGLWGLNNFYMYRDENSSRFQLFVWDKDGTFLQSDFPVTQGVSENVLARRVLQIPTYFKLYLDTMEEAAMTVVSSSDAKDSIRSAGRSGNDQEDRRSMAASIPGWMEREIRREANQIRPAVLNDAYKPGSNEDFEAGIAQMIEFARQRPQFVMRETGRIRQSAFR